MFFIKVSQPFAIVNGCAGSALAPKVALPYNHLVTQQKGNELWIARKLKTWEHTRPWREWSLA
jgi:hypothetical protein